jgi:tetratricopeptide (TPR) repeat protein
MATHPVSRSSRPAIAVVFLCLVVVLALLGLTYSRRERDYWKEVERARFLVDRGQPDRALEILRAIADDRPGAPEGLTVAARALLVRGSISSARRTLERSLAMKFDQADAAKMLAAIYLASGDGNRGVGMLKKAAELDPVDFRPWFAMGKVYHDLGELEKSAEAYSEALNRKPPPAEAKECRIGRARALLDANQAAQAGEDLEVLRTREPDEPQILALAARQARDLGRTEEAEELAGRALAADAENFDALMVRARIRFLSRRTRLAIEDLEAAVRVKPNDVPTLQLLLQAQKSLGMTKEAQKTQALADQARERLVLMDSLTKAINQHPEDPKPRWQMGQAAMDGELYTLAYQCFQAALDLDPKFGPAREGLETLRTRKGFDYQAATKLELQLPGKSTARRRPGP